VSPKSLAADSSVQTTLRTEGTEYKGKKVWHCILRDGKHGGWLGTGSMT
jgi:hypothetical protein